MDGNPRGYNKAQRMNSSVEGCESDAKKKENTWVFLKDLCIYFVCIYLFDFIYAFDRKKY